jgi:hypothetical protein
MKRFVKVTVTVPDSDSDKKIPVEIIIHFRGEKSNHADVDRDWAHTFDLNCLRCFGEEIKKLVEWTLEVENDFLINELTVYEDEDEERSA